MATRRHNLRLRWDDRSHRAHIMSWSSSSFTAHVLLRTPVRDAEALRLFVEQAIVRGVRLIAAVGCEALKTEGEVDYIIVGDRFEQSRFIATTAHATSRDAISFIASTFGAKRFFEVWL